MIAPKELIELRDDFKRKYPLARMHFNRVCFSPCRFYKTYNEWFCDFRGASHYEEMVGYARSQWYVDESDPKAVASKERFLFGGMEAIHQIRDFFADLRLSFTEKACMVSFGNYFDCMTDEEYERNCRKFFRLVWKEIVPDLPWPVQNDPDDVEDEYSALYREE